MTDQYDPAAIMGGLYGEGIIGLKQAFAPEWADRMYGEIMALFEEARAIPGGVLPRGPERFYVEVQADNRLLRKEDLRKKYVVLDEHGVPHLRLDPRVVSL